VKKFVAGDQHTDEKRLLGMGEPDEVAQAALLLASNESRRITGTIVPADSGWSAGIANVALEGNRIVRPNREAAN
jgi:NAD(P)-dependent dehydrogenase (short-subunit alcohol dehydrogenase family)